VNLTNFVAQGECSPGLRAALVDRERQISEISARLLDAHPDSLRAELRTIRGFVTARMQNLRTIMKSDIANVRAELAKHIEKITLTPSGECYIASGTWNFVERGSICGAGARHARFCHRLSSSSRWPHESKHRGRTLNPLSKMLP
jgi:hypothetical protein